MALEENFSGRLKKQKTKLICTIDNCGFFFVLFILFLHLLAVGWLRPSLPSSVYSYLVPWPFFLRFFFYYLTISVLSNFVHTKKRRDKRTELTDGEEFGRGRGADLELAVCHKVREQAENRAREAE